MAVRNRARKIYAGNCREMGALQFPAAFLRRKRAEAVCRELDRK